MTYSTTCTTHTKHACVMLTFYGVVDHLPIQESNDQKDIFHAHRAVTALLDKGK